MGIENQTIVEELMKIKDIKTLWPAQKVALEAGLLTSNKNFVVIAPTASGKTLTAEFVAWQTLKKGGKVIYLVPSTALINDKEAEFSYLQSNYKVSRKDWLNSDLTITTFEFFYRVALLNRKSVENFNLAVIDEFHVLYDQTRGFNLEKALTMLKELKIRIICLSATFEDKEEISGWLDANLVVVPESERKVPLDKGSIDLTKFAPREKMKTFYSFLAGAQDKHPMIVFCSTKDHTRSRALTLCDLMQAVGDPSKLRSQIEAIVSRTTLTSLEEDLYSCLCKGVAFHHSGLDEKLRKMVEDKFKNKEIKVLFATTGLAFGINFPARTVILADLTLYQEKAQEDVKTYLFLQMAGRAGRPKFDEKGFAYVVTKDSADVSRSKKLLEGTLEKGFSHIMLDDLFKKAILELIFARRNREDQIISFFENTFYNFQSTRSKGLVEFDLKAKLGKSLKEMINEGFVEFMGAQGYRLTDLGHVTAQFLLGTFKAYALDAFLALNDYLDRNGGAKIDFDLILELSRKFEGARTFKISRERSEEIEDFYINRGIEKPFHAEYSAYAVFKGWMENMPKHEIEGDFKVYASALDSVADELSKILEAYKELATKKRKRIDPKFDMLKDRISHGVREEEIPFAKLKGLGRDSVRELSTWCNEVLRGPLHNYQGDIISVLIRLYQDKGRDDNVLLTTLANGPKMIGPKKAQKIVNLVKSSIG